MFEQSRKPEKSVLSGRTGSKSDIASDPALIMKQLKRNMTGSLQLFAEDEEEEKVQRKARNDEELQMKTDPTSEGTQTQMPEDVKSKMENSFGTDFSDVNIYKDSDQATNVGALAYTQGNSVHFAPSQYDPESQKGQELLGHELTHVVQQREGRVKPDTDQHKGFNINSDAALEKEADVMGEKAAQGKMADVTVRGNGVQRKGEDDKSDEDPIFYANLAKKVYNAIRGLGTNENDVYIALKQLVYNANKISKFKQVYFQIYNTRVESDIRDDFSDTWVWGKERTKALSYLIPKVRIVVKRKPSVHSKTAISPHESYKSKPFKTVSNARLYNLDKKTGKVTNFSLKTKAKKYSFGETSIPGGLKIKIIKEDISIDKPNKETKVVLVKINDDNNLEWNGKEVWTTRSNVTESEIKKGVIATIRESATEIEVEHKTIPKDTELMLTDYFYKKGVNYAPLYIKVYDKKSKKDYGWILASSFGKNLYNESLEFTDAEGEYISKEENHKTINRDNTNIYLVNGYDYDTYKEVDGKKLKIPNKTKIKVVDIVGNRANVVGTDGTKYGWTWTGNYKKTNETDVYEIIKPDAYIRLKQKKYTPIGKLKAGDLVITKGIAENPIYTKVSLTEKVKDKYKEKSGSECFVPTDNLTEYWAKNVKGEHATWEKIDNQAVYTGQADLVIVMSGPGRIPVKRMEGNSKDPSNDMYAKYSQMAKAAEADGIILSLASGFRDYSEQKYLDDNEHKPGFNSAASPGKSTHQNGIAIDLNHCKGSKKDGNTPTNKWLMKNAYKFKFVKKYKVYGEAHHWEYLPSQIKSPKQIEKQVGKEKKKYTRYYFGIWSPDLEYSAAKTSEWPAANCYDE